MQLTDKEIYDVCNDVFGDLGQDAVIIMGAICLAESAGNVGAVGDNFASGHQAADSPYRWDYGLAQINSVHGFDPHRLTTDARYNVACARNIYGWQGFQAWTTYKGGQFKQYLSRMSNAGYAPPVAPPAQDLSPDFARSDLALLYYVAYNMTSKASIAPQPRENGARVYKVVIRD